MDVMVAMKDSCKLLSGLFGNFHNDSDSTFHADTYIDQSSHSDDEHDSDWEGLWILRKKGKRWKMLYICKGFVIATIWSWTIPQMATAPSIALVTRRAIPIPPGTTVAAFGTTSMMTQKGTRNSSRKPYICKPSARGHYQQIVPLEMMLYGTLRSNHSSTTFSTHFMLFSKKYPEICTFWQFIGHHSGRFKYMNFCRHYPGSKNFV